MLIAVKGKSTQIESIKQDETCLILVMQKGKIKIEPYSNEIIRIVYTQREGFSNKGSLGVVPFIPQCEWSYEDEAYVIKVKTKKIELQINKKTSAFTFYDRMGNLLTKEPEGGGKTLVPFDSYETILDEDSVMEKIVTPDGVKTRIKEAKTVFSKSLYHTRLEFEWDDQEALYGFGQQEEGTLNLRGTRQYVHQGNMKIAMPFMVSTKGYGVLLDTYSPVIFNDNEYGSYIYNEAATELDYYFIQGSNLDNVIKGYRTITGKAAMLPKWAFGFISSQERYESQQEIMEIVDEYQRRKVPLDAIVLDWQSWEEGMWGQKSFDTTRFPDALSMTESLHHKGVRFMISIWPNMYKDTLNYVQMVAEGGLFQQSEIYDAFKEKNRNLYWSQANEGLFSKGVDAWWCDSSEPFTPEWNLEIKPEPDQNFMEFHKTARVYIDEALTNAYPLVHAKAMYEGQRSITDSKRVVNLTRSGYTGIQRYGAILWSGDISAKWKTLESQIAVGLNLCASGLPYWTLDIGAFFVKKGHMWFWDGDFEEGILDLGYRELYTRWYQFGAFLPIFRSHGTDTRREIWQFGDEGDMFYDALKKFTILRYRLIPYIYSLAGMVLLKDYTLFRLLAFDFQDDLCVYNIKDQYMFGSSLMICPVVTPMYFGPDSEIITDMAKVRDVYLPSGSVWYDFWTKETYKGGQTIPAKATMDIIPIFVKGGAIIPTTKGVKCTDDIMENVINILIYPGANGVFTLYQDENDNYNYEKGDYTTIDFAWTDKEQTLLIKRRVGHFSTMPIEITFSIEIIGQETKCVLYDGTEVLVK